MLYHCGHCGTVYEVPDDGESRQPEILVDPRDVQWDMIPLDFRLPPEIHRLVFPEDYLPLVSRAVHTNDSETVPRAGTYGAICPR